MIRFIDGPAEGVELRLLRVPVLLRVVRSPGGKWDALDQLDDEARPRERIWLYVCCTKPTWTHIKAAKPSESGFYFDADYRLCWMQPDDAVMRDNARWAEWCESVRDEVELFVRRGFVYKPEGGDGTVESLDVR